MTTTRSRPITHPGEHQPVHRLFRPDAEAGRWMLVLFDLVACSLAVIGAFWLWSFSHGRPLAHILSFRWYWIPGMAMGWCVLAWLAEMYEPRYLMQVAALVHRLVVVGAILLTAYLVLFFAVAPHMMMIRLPVVYFLVLATILAGGWRCGYLWLASRGAFRRRALIVGAGWAGRTIAELLGEDGSAIEPLGFVDDDADKSGSIVAGLPVLGSSADTMLLSQRHQIEVIIYAVTHEMTDDVFQVLLDCQSSGLSLVRMADLYQVMTGRVPVEHMRPDWFLFSRGEEGLDSYAYRIFVHMVDGLFLVTAGLFMLLAGPWIALAVKLSSPGPVFYRQVRLGFLGQPFELVKFRSMVADAEAYSGARWASLDDPRVTSVGRLLRYTRLDELPQLINILRGDLHLIGPRPERPEFVADLEQVIPFYRARLAIKPGLTGWAQVEYDYGFTVEGSQIKLEYDLYYIQNRSVLLDAKILLKTVATVLAMRGT